jgi:hypothetical protein
MAMPRRTVLAIASSFLLLFFLLGYSVVSWAQTSDNNGDSSKPWTSSSESQDSASGSRTRKVETHSQDGNRTVDRQSVEVLRSGGYEPYQDTETETVRVNDTTTRTTVRTYGRDSKGQRALVQTTEEEKHTLADGGSRVVRSTSNPDSNGRSQVVQREEQVTKKTAPNVEQTTTTVYLPGVNGGMAPAMKVEERQEHTGEHTVQIEKSTLLPDGEGNWQAGEVKQSTVTDDGKVRTSDEHISRVGADGRLAEVSRTVGRDVQDGAGEGHSTVETFSTEVPGSSPDGTLHIVQKVSTVTRNGLSGSQTTQQQVEQVNPGDPNAGLEVTIQSTDVQTPGAAGTQNTRTIQTRGSNGSLGIVSVDMTKSDKSPAVQVEIAPAAKPK